MARAALTAAILTTMATPALAHPTLEDYVEGHTHEVLLPTLNPNLESQIELELAVEAREEWREIDRRYDARLKRLEREREAQQLTLAVSTPTTTGEIESVIRAVFGAYGDQAVAVAMCESTLSTSAVNGTHLGLFQMGVPERATYGHGDSAYEQAQAAYAYFVASGSDWSPWVCQP